MYRNTIYVKSNIRFARCDSAQWSAARPTMRLTQTDYVMLADLRHALRQFAAFSEEAADAVGLTPAQHQALLAIRGAHEPLSIGDLAGRLIIRHHSAVGLVDRLIEHGLVRRTTDTEDRRRVELSLTARGEAVLARLSVAHRDELTRLGPRIRALLDRLEGTSRPAALASARPKTAAKARAVRRKRSG
jgi:DNA-binding MarR family transcriptional regulator